MGPGAVVGTGGIKLSRSSLGELIPMEQIQLAEVLVVDFSL